MAVIAAIFVCVGAAYAVDNGKKINKGGRGMAPGGVGHLIFTGILVLTVGDEL